MTDVRRPDPSELLARAKRAEGRASAGVSDEGAGRRGRLKIFFGMSPGVGKTFAMLAAAQRLAAQGIDVVIGLVETHGRTETEQMTLGLDVVPRREVAYRGPGGASAPITLHEFDLDAALRRRPDLLLVDELAHTNARDPSGAGNEKRWQDVLACVAAGIDVYTTLNVQHIESLNDIVAKITGVRVRETVPDSVIERADEIELVDLPPAALLERMKAGKVYVPDYARHAIDSFFRVGNLTALRQLALRRTAEWVDQRMREYKEEHAISAVWPATERILVAVSPSPMAPKLVRAAKRMAAGLGARLLAVYVEPPAADGVPSADRDRVMSTLRLAESLGAETATISTGAGPASAAADLVAFARARNVNRIVIGKTQQSRWAEALSVVLRRGSFTSEVIRHSGDIDVHCIQGDVEEPPIESREDGARRADATDARAFSYVGSAAVVAASVALSALAFRPPDLSSEAMILLGGVVVSALWFGRGPAAMASVLAVVAFNFLFTEPRFTLFVDESGHVLTFGVMLSVGLVVGTLASTARRQAIAAREREARTASLYSMARELTASESEVQVAAVAARHVATAFESDCLVAARAPAAVGGVDVLASDGAPDWIDSGAAPGHVARERSVARWVLDNGTPAGVGTRTLAGSVGRFVPLTTGQGLVGVLAIRPRSEDARLRLLTADRLLLLDALASQIALSLERVQLINSRHAARIEAESERLRSSLLSSVSHDLRTPLASIAGSASALREGGERLDAETRADLVATVETEANRLNDLIANLMFATRLEAGAGGIDLKREWTTVEEIVGAGLARHRAALADRTVRTSGLSDQPMIKVDSALFAMVIHNLVENALRYSPEGTPLSISAWSADNMLCVRVADEGPGLSATEADRVFERFYRGRSARVADVAAGRGAGGGLGLGLTICQGIVKAHGGRIWAEPNAPRGVSFLFSIPLEESQPQVAPAPDEHGSECMTESPA